MEASTGGKFNMKLNIPTSDQLEAEEFISLVSHRISKAILENLLKKNPKFFNQLSRELTTQEVASRKSIHKKLNELESKGILLSNMELLSDEDLPRWVRQYRISKEHRDWIETLFG